MKLGNTMGPLFDLKYVGTGICKKRKNANQFSCSDFFNWQIFSKVPPEKYGFLPYKVVVSFILWPFFIKIFRKFWENVLF